MCNAPTPGPISQYPTTLTVALTHKRRDQEGISEELERGMASV
jgi:hypothetical protein